MLRKYLVLFLSVLLAVSLVGCNNSNDSNQSEIVAIVNGEEIMKAEYHDLLEQQKQLYQQFGVDFNSTDGKELLSELELQVLDELVNLKLLSAEATSAGHTAAESKIQAELEAIKSQFEDEAQFNQALKINNLTLSQLEQDIANSIIVHQYLETLQASIDTEVTVTEEEIEDYYLQYSASVEEPEELDAIRSQIEMKLIQDKEQQQFGVYLDEVIAELREKADIEILL